MKAGLDIVDGVKDDGLDEPVKVIGDNWVPVGLLAVCILDLNLNVFRVQVDHHLIEKHLALPKGAITLLVRIAVGNWIEQLHWIVLLNPVQTPS